MKIEISAAVGEGGVNLPTDVRLIQAALNRLTGPVPMLWINETGICDEPTIWSIRQFQISHFAPLFSLGRIEPGDATLHLLRQQVAPVMAVAVAADPPAQNNLSGAAWWHANQAKYPNSSKVEDLDPGFRASVQNFLKALNEAKASVTVSATRRNAIRAYLMHWSFRLWKGQVKAQDIPAADGCAIEWNHGDEVLSRKAAKEMVDLFGIVFQPSLTSLHIEGKAIDMDISWTGTLSIADARGNTSDLEGPRSGATNAGLHKIGASYGVVKLLTDAPHWSVNGH